MASNIGTGQINLIYTKWIRKLETVLDILGKDGPPSRKKIPVEVYMPK